MCPCRANSSKAKAEPPRTPTSPTFSPSPCFLAPCYLTGDSVRDKCIEMLTAALRMDGEWGRGGAVLELGDAGACGGWGVERGAWCRSWLP